jgi:hypothetical protein
VAECQLPKLDVAGSTPVARSRRVSGAGFQQRLVDHGLVADPPALGLLLGPREGLGAESERDRLVLRGSLRGPAQSSPGSSERTMGWRFLDESPQPTCPQSKRVGAHTYRRSADSAQPRVRGPGAKESRFPAVLLVISGWFASPKHRHAQDVTSPVAQPFGLGSSLLPACRGALFDSSASRLGPPDKVIL